jgi:hypothetical protein
LTRIVLQIGLVDALEDDELDAAVPAPTLFVVLGTDGLGFAVAAGPQATKLDTAIF